MTLSNKPIAKICGRCGKAFQCGTRESHGACWCSLYPALQAPRREEDCMCSDCLGKATLFTPLDGENQ